MQRFTGTTGRRITACLTVLTCFGFLVLKRGAHRGDEVGKPFVFVIRHLRDHGDVGSLLIEGN